MNPLLKLFLITPVKERRLARGRIMYNCHGITDESKLVSVRTYNK